MSADDARAHSNRARSLLVATAAVLCLLTVVESITVLTRDAGLRPFDLPVLAWAILGLASRVLAVPLGLVAGIVLIELGCGPVHAVRRYHALLVGLACAGIAAHGYHALTRYDPFAGYPLFVVAFGGLAAWLALLVTHLQPLRLRGSLLRRITLGFAALSLVGGALSHRLNDVLFHGQYPTLHLATLVGSFALTLAGLYRLVDALGWHGRPAVGKAIGALCLAVLAVVAPRSEEYEPYILAHSIVGEAYVTQGTAPLAVQELSGIETIDLVARPRFAEHVPLPTLPTDARLEDYNVLLIMSEATRFDRTSLVGESDTTPFLEQRSEGALVATRAFSPSSGTLHSVSSIFTMKPTSMAALETWNRSWWGELRDEEPTVAEVFSDAGYHTFWIGHNFKSAFTRTILGFQQGFAFVDLVADSGEDPDVDAEIARRAIAHFKQVRGDDRRFFGWVFFGSPHAPYLVHDAGAPAATDEQRYRQELRYMDTQLERTLQALEDEGLQERTIVVFMGDHGEEFREHGGTLHKSTVYTESVHVPLVVWLPWLEQGMRVEAPISTAHVLPWLFQWARSPAFGQFVDARLRQTIGPLLRETEGAVVVELIGHDRMKSSLVYEGYKINYDFATKLYELYAVTEDPMEQTNLFRSRPDLAREYEARFERYLRLRAEKQRFILEPKKKPDEDEPR